MPCRIRYLAASRFRARGELASPPRARKRRSPRARGISPGPRGLVSTPFDGPGTHRPYGRTSSPHLLDALHCEGHFNGPAEIREVRRLDEVVEGPIAEGELGVAFVANAADHDHLDAGRR